MLSKEHEELKLKIENITKETNDSLETEQYNPYNEKCYENVIVESCDDLITKENDDLK